MIEKTFKIVGNDLSDGYHTFDDLYEHRNLLWIAFVLSDGCPGQAFLTKDHFEGWDLLLVENSMFGQMSYHVPIKYRYLYDGIIKERSKDDAEKSYDKHTPSDVLERLIQWCRW